MTQARNNSKQYNPENLDDLIQNFRKIAGKGYGSGPVSKMIIRPTIVRELAAIVQSGDQRMWYVKSIVDHGFDRKTAYKIVNEAFRLAEPRWKEEMLTIQTDPEKAKYSEAGAGTPASSATKAAPKQAAPAIPATKAAKAEPLMNGDARESDGFVYDCRLQDYRDPKTLTSGFHFARENKIWDARERQKVPISAVPDGYKRIEDGWEWDSYMKMYRDPKGGTNPYGLELTK